jgi:hypothetical protein
MVKVNSDFLILLYIMEVMKWVCLALLEVGHGCLILYGK